MNIRPKHNIYKSDVFSLGVCFMNIALLESCNDIYNYTKFTINEMALEEKLEKLKILYPIELINVIQQMVIIDEKNRPDFFQLEKLCEEQKKIFLERTNGSMNRPANEEFATNPQLVFILKKALFIMIFLYFIDLFNKCPYFELL